MLTSSISMRCEISSFSNESPTVRKIAICGNCWKEIMRIVLSRGASQFSFWHRCFFILSIHFFQIHPLSISRGTKLSLPSLFSSVLEKKKLRLVINWQVMGKFMKMLLKRCFKGVRGEDKAVPYCNLVFILAQVLFNIVTKNSMTLCFS